MNREEAKEIIISEKSRALHTYGKTKFVEALDVAITTLSQEEQSEWERDHEILKAYADGQESMKPCNDAISRRAVIERLKKEDKILYTTTGLNYLVRAIEELPSVSTEKIGRWIPVSERLPKEYDLVLVTEKYGFVDTARFVHNDFTEMDEWIVADDETIDVIAWMPLPNKPYKGESEDKE